MGLGAGQGLGKHVKPGVEAAGGYHSRIEEFKGARGRIARVGKKRLPVLLALLVQFLKHPEGHDDLPADPETVGPRTTS